MTRAGRSCAGCSRRRRLIALHEHEVFAQSAAWNTGSCDQWSVEPDKVLVKRIEPALTDPYASAAAAAGTVPGLVPSTTAFVPTYRTLRK